MPQVIFTPQALHDLDRLRSFLRSKSPMAAQKAAATIIQTIQILSGQPEIGRPTDDTDQRELLINFGNTGYVARYHFNGKMVVILALRHQKEAGYQSPPPP